MSYRSSVSPSSARLGILAVFLLGALARCAYLGSNPAGVFRDEAEKGYSAWCLARVGGVFDFFAPPDTVSVSGGEDSGPGRQSAREGSTAQIQRPHFVRWPLFVNVWGSLTSMVYQYAALPFVAVWGPNAWTVRIPAALVGSLTVLLSFFLARRLTGRLDAALWTMTLMACSPWHVVFSRWAQQGVFVPFFVSAALLAFLRLVGEKNARGPESQIPDRKCRVSHPAYFAAASALLFGLAFYSYSGAQPFLLALWVATAWVFRRELAKRRRATLVGAVVLVLAVAPTLYATFGEGGAGMGRFARLSVWGTDAPFGIRLLTFLKNYLVHFSPQFLFLTGDALDRHGLRGFGEMLHVELPFLVAGLCVAARRRSASDRLLLAWFFLFPLSAALTNEGIPHALRTLHAVPCPQILSAMGLVAVFDWLRKKRSERGKWAARARAAIVGVLAIDVAAFATALFVFYPYYSAPDFQYGLRESIEAAREAADRAGSADARLLVLVASGLPGLPELYYFLAKTPPESILREGTPGGRIWLLAPGIPDPLALSRLLGPGESALASSNLFREGAPYFGRPFAEEIEMRPVYWRPGPFSGNKIEIYRVLSRVR